MHAIQDLQWNTVELIWTQTDSHIEVINIILLILTHFLIMLMLTLISILIIKKPQQLKSQNCRSIFRSYAGGCFGGMAARSPMADRRFSNMFTYLTGIPAHLSWRPAGHPTGCSSSANAPGWWSRFFIGNQSLFLRRAKRTKCYLTSGLRGVRVSVIDIVIKTSLTVPQLWVTQISRKTAGKVSETRTYIRVMSDMIRMAVADQTDDNCQTTCTVLTMLA